MLNLVSCVRVVLSIGLKLEGKKISSSLKRENKVQRQPFISFVAFCSPQGVFTSVCMNVFSPFAVCLLLSGCFSLVILIAIFFFFLT